MRTLLLILCLLFLPQLALAGNTPASSKEPVIAGDFASLKHTATGRVDKIIDASTVLMKDGKIVRLLGIGYPLSSGDDVDAATVIAKARLEMLLPESTEVMFYQKRQTSDIRRGRVNRMGHVLAHLVRKDDGRWINGTLLNDGAAWTMTDSANTDMAAQMLALEDEARKNGKGLWAKGSADGLLTPDTAVQGDGQFRVVEGVINRAATSKNNLFLNFGTDWKKDFTVKLSPDIRRKLSRQGIDPMGLAGQKVRVRGWLRKWNGPYMELDTVERIEIVTTLRQSPEPSPELSTDAVENTVHPAPSGQFNP